MENDECPCCGSDIGEREAYKEDCLGEPGREAEPAEVELYPCPFCGFKKCLMCDAGDDVECPLCPDGS